MKKTYEKPTIKSLRLKGLFDEHLFEAIQVGNGDWVLVFRYGDA